MKKDEGLKIKCTNCNNQVDIDTIDSHSIECVAINSWDKQNKITTQLNNKNIHNKSENKSENKGKRQRRKTIFSSFFEKSPKKEEVIKHEISGPINLKHESHIGWDMEKGFDVRNIPSQWKELFKKAGVKKKELKDKQVCDFLMKTIANEISHHYSQSNQLGNAICLYKFVGLSDIEISANVGDDLTIIDNSDENWWYVLNNFNSNVGYIPSNYLHLLQSSPRKQSLATSSTETTNPSEYSFENDNNNPFYNQHKGYPLPKLSSAESSFDSDSFSKSDNSILIDNNSPIIKKNENTTQISSNENNLTTELKDDKENITKEENITKIQFDKPNTLSNSQLNSSDQMKIETKTESAPNEIQIQPNIFQIESKIPLLELIKSKQQSLKPVNRLELPKLPSSQSGLANILGKAMNNRRISSIEHQSNSTKSQDSEEDDDWSD
eukprot:TRINITY_DN7629_c0_g1_i1.p1 TRINITY_DN7629_c0_g1~~TRINITY_DN7629_c0_g1_i1.p1  ORF type:complete len:438 (-),score=120.26 TRINITY_DN7629_c0_g1_i1:71-1384(-)